MKLTIDSICLISSIIDKLNIDDKFINEMIEMGKITNNEDETNIDNLKKKIGMKIAVKIGSKLHEVRDEFVKFVSTYKEISEEEATKINVIDIIKELIEDKDFTSFFKQKVMSE